MEKHPLTFGLPRMHKEAGERRDFLPALVAEVAKLGVEVYVERGIGSGMGLSDQDYLDASPRVHVVDHLEAFKQDVVLVLRCPEMDELEKLKPGATLISMIHFPTRPKRIRRLTEMGLHAISLDSIADDDGKRLVENMKAVAWNGVEAGFQALAKNFPEFDDEARGPIRVTVMGAGLVGKHAVEAATKYGDRERATALDGKGLAGVEVTVLGRNLTGRWQYMREQFLQTDLLVDATQRSDPSRPLVPNEWLSWLPQHAVVCDLVVDPYVLDGNPPTVRSLEGIPRGSLDQYIFWPDDPKWDQTVPKSIDSTHRRTVATCYSWPGVHPKECMALYGRQLGPMLETLFRRGGVDALRPDGDFFERALCRASLRQWNGEAPSETDEGEAQSAT
jgi:alanine dehydrogenase